MNSLYVVLKVHKIKYSSLAQSVEHSAVNRSVVGSSPTGGVKKFADVKFANFIFIISGKCYLYRITMKILCIFYILVYLESLEVLKGTFRDCKRLSRSQASPALGLVAIAKRDIFFKKIKYKRG